jgi:hypothetical protein
MPTINVRNVAQAALLEMEIKGQLSDGHWENTRPDDHWQIWCDADVVVEPRNVGRDFWARKDNYGLTSKDLLDVVGERMERYARLALTVGLERAVGMRDLTDLEGKLYDEVFLARVVREEAERDGAPHWAERREQIRALEPHDLRSAMEDVTLYDRKDLLRDLRDLKKIFRIVKSGG